jgi:2-keto-4-pentenoate hydratase/2-oxohepta-3-ene-1,7-dioic acid hydratase in catechol pathway
MRVCRYLYQGKPHAGFYGESHVVSVAAAAKAYTDATHEKVALPEGDDLLPLLPPDGSAHAAAQRVAAWLARNDGKLPSAALVPTRDVHLLVPVPRPNKLFLLAGNYAAHLEEGGQKAVERQETFPYVFMKPPSTTLVPSGGTVQIPAISPDHIDWELELAVVIGRGGRHIKEAEALRHVAGYTVINDISNRKFRPNPGRKERKNDAFFDWLHGKWFDSFCPCGPCITSAAAIPDPQKLKMKLSVNGEVKQDATTAQQIFPVAAVIEFISSFVTLEPGDIISTGTPSGVGNATGTYLRPGDAMEAWIEHIGTLTSKVEAEA